jgi:hypothetical protein
MERWGYKLTENVEEEEIEESAVSSRDDGPGERRPDPKLREEDENQEDVVKEGEDDEESVTESTLRKIVREAIRRKLKRNG